MVTFGFNVRKSEDGSCLDGTRNVYNHASNRHLKCLTVVDYEQVGNTATSRGIAQVNNGVEQTYRITVADKREPNQGLDFFSISAETFDAAGFVPVGNVQVHDEESLP